MEDTTYKRICTTALKFERSKKKASQEITTMNNFFICQPDELKSCGACCGLYNYESFSRRSIKSALDFRTDLFDAMKPQGEGLFVFRDIVSQDRRVKLLDEIYCCEFLGFVDEGRRKVGCLIHPAVMGEDLRDYAYYGAQTCAEHKCLSYSYLSREEVLPVIYALDDWYLYGMCVTDIDLIKEFYKFISDIRYETLKPEKLLKSEKAMSAFRDYLRLKEKWHYRGSGKRFGQYIFHNGRYYVAEIDWNSLGVQRPPEWRILRSLGSDFNDKTEVEDALRIIRDLVRTIAESL